MAAATTSLRDRLTSRKRPSLTVPLADADLTGLSREVALAEEAWRTAHLEQGNQRSKHVADARRDLDAAIAALDACYIKVTVTALPPEHFEKLIEEHPAREDEDEAWNVDTFPRALFFACADDELTAEEWAVFLDERCSQAERDTLLLAAQHVNVRAPSAAIPKD